MRLTSRGSTTTWTSSRRRIARGTRSSSTSTCARNSASASTSRASAVPMARTPDPHLRERLIAAATADFAEVGYAGATLDGIAARAGVTKGGVYFHFAGKEELFFPVLDHWRQRRRLSLQLPAVGVAGAAEAL